MESVGAESRGHAPSLGRSDPVPTFVDGRADAGSARRWLFGDALCCVVWPDGERNFVA